MSILWLSEYNTLVIWQPAAHLLERERKRSEFYTRYTPPIERERERERGEMAEGRITFSSWEKVLSLSPHSSFFHPLTQGCGSGSAGICIQFADPNPGGKNWTGNNINILSIFFQLQQNLHKLIFYKAFKAGYGYGSGSTWESSWIRMGKNSWIRIRKIWMQIHSPALTLYVISFVSSLLLVYTFSFLLSLIFFVF